MDDGSKRSITWDELEAAYYDNARGLLDGGADIILIETIFDTLNAKAAIAAVLRLFDERSLSDTVPIMLSAAIADAAGRLLAGQTPQAFCVSVQHARPWSVGLNCSLGAAMLKPYIKALADCAPCRVTVHPNAGLPDELGNYTETPEKTAAALADFAACGLINAAGGCCGTTPQHIAAIKAALSNGRPRPLPAPSFRTWLSGLEALEVPHTGELTIVGERGNAPGSNVFLNLIKAGKFEEGLRLIRKNIACGAKIVDICMDDGLIEGKSAMSHFVNLVLSDPQIAKIPFVIDSSRFDVIEAGLKCIAGKVIANSISLKEGEAEFLRKGRALRRLGAAAMVMLFDESGQACTYERKIEIAARSYNLLVKDGFPAQDIFIDPNILAIATGMKEHDKYALDFIRAIPEILRLCPHAHVSAGVSNLSFSFRSNWNVRNAIHAVFLKLAHDAGLSVAIVNIAALGIYEKLQSDFKEAITDLLLCRTEDAPEKILQIAIDEQKTTEKIARLSDIPKEIPLCERITAALVQGNDESIESDVLLLAKEKTVIEIVEGPLMKGMECVGDLFGDGKMFLPQVIRSARVMKKAVSALEPLLKTCTNTTKQQAKKIIMATVRGDVHDIGKTIVGTVLACNGFEIIDLGVMVSAEKILQTAIDCNAAIIGVSGLVTPSLDEMMHIALEMEKRHFTIPLLIGGAAASLAHTALKIAPLYRGPVIYVSDAGKAPVSVRSLLSDKLPRFMEEIETQYEQAVKRHHEIENRKQFISLEEARNNKFKIDWKNEKIHEPLDKAVDLNNYDIEKIVSLLDWDSFVEKWFSYNKIDTNIEDTNEKHERMEKERLLHDAYNMIESIIKNKIIQLRGVVKFFPCYSLNEDIFITAPNNAEIKLSFLRNQEKKKSGGANTCLADFIKPKDADTHKCIGNQLYNDWIGFFALSAGFGVEEAKNVFIKNNDTYSAIMLSFLADSLAEAFSEETHKRLCPHGIRPAFGYPCCPDHNDKKIAFSLLQAEEKTGLALTETSMIKPVSSICGMYFLNPASYYFSTGGKQRI